MATTMGRFRNMKCASFSRFLRNRDSTQRDRPSIAQRAAVLARSERLTACPCPNDPDSPARRRWPDHAVVLCPSFFSPLDNIGGSRPRKVDAFVVQPRAWSIASCTSQP